MLRIKKRHFPSRIHIYNNNSKSDGLRILYFKDFQIVRFQFNFHGFDIRTKTLRKVGQAAKYILITILSVMLFRAGAAYAYQVRGYHSLGGELAFLFIPAFWYFIEAEINGIKQRDDNEK